MSFTFEARTLLELGKELISSDEVAVYELVKNAFDAGSKKITILAHVLITYSDFDFLRDQLNDKDKKFSRSDAEAKLSKVITDLEHPAVEKLLKKLKGVKTREKFAEALTKFYVKNNYLEVVDTGEGMSLKNLQDVYLRVGTTSRRAQNQAGAQNLGDKGIGRLSAMRLGERLEVQTSTADETHWNVLQIDWGLFSHDSGLSVDQIEIEPEVGDKKEDQTSSGTSIRISDLTSDWDASRFTDILQGRLARMIDPFQPGLANKLIVARHNGVRVMVPSVPQKLLAAAHAVCSATFEFVAGEPTLTGTINYRYRERSAKIDERGAQVYTLAQSAIKRRGKRGHASHKIIPVKKSAFEQLGKFKVEIYWFNRLIVQAIEGLSDNQIATRQEIKNWSGGPMLYRHGFRILPYGDPSDDWLGLDEAAFGQSGFKLNRQQVIGRVSLDTSHEFLGEQTNREGLVQSDASDALRRLLVWIVHTEMRGLINAADDAEKINSRLQNEDVQRVSSARERAERDLKKLENQPEINQELVKSLSKSVSQLSTQSAELIERIKKVVEEADEEREKFVYLAGIGLMTESIFHELERSVSHTLSELSTTDLNEDTLLSLKEQLKTLQKRISAFDELTGEKRQAKSSFDLRDVINNVALNHERQFERHGIELILDLPGAPFRVKAVRGMVIQILENIVSNAVYWLKQQVQYEDDFEPTLTISLDAELKTLTIGDNGPGVLEDRRDRIFQPFVTTKPTGQGRGLGLFISRDMAEYHDWSLDLADTVGEIREDRVNEFILDMG